MRPRPGAAAMGNASGFAAICQIMILCGLAALPLRAAECRVEGVTRPLHDETLSLTVSGIVERVAVREGAAVKAGDVLLELDREQEELETQRRKLIWKNQADLASAEARVTTTESLLTGTRQLYDTSRSVSREQLQKAELAHQESVAELELLKLREEREEIEYKMAAEQLRRRTLRAPMDGIISDILIEQGEHCQPGQPLIRLVDVTKFYFVANVEVSVAHRMELNQKIDVVITAGPEEVRKEGVVDLVSPVVDPASGLQEIKLIVDNADLQVKPGVAATLLLPEPKP